MTFAIEDRLPGVDLFRAMKIASCKFWQFRIEHLIEEVRSAGHFPGIELGSQLLSAIPEMVGLLFLLSGMNRVSRNRDAALSAHGSSKIHDISVCRNVVRNSKAQDVS